MNSLFYFTLAACAASIISSCGNKAEEHAPADDRKENSTAASPAIEIPPATQLWAEQVQSTTEISRPTDWEEKDWNEIYKNIDREKIFNTIKDAVMKGELVAYNYFDESQVYTPDDIDAMLNFTSNSETYNPETGELKTRTVEQHLTSKDIAVVKVKEKWLFDPKTYNMYKIVTDLGFFVNSYTSDSLVRGTRPLFYVKLGKARQDS
jgi:hypothetical protein